MSDAKTSTPDLTALQADLTALKRDVAALLGQFTVGAANTAQNAASNVEDGARQIYRSLSTEGEKSLKAIGQKVEEQPLMSLLIAFGIGYIGARLLDR